MSGVDAYIVNIGLAFVCSKSTSSPKQIMPFLSSYYSIAENRLNYICPSSKLASLRDGSCGCAGAAWFAGTLDGFDDLHRLIICNFAKDDVFAVQPLSHNGGDEKLRPVAN